MISKQQRVWGIRSGEQYFDATDLFTHQNYIGIGWSAAGALHDVEANQQKIRQHLEQTHRHDASITPHRFALGAGDLYRFLYVAQVGDIIAYHSKSEGSIYVGTVVSDYTYDVSTYPNAPHLRKVKWHSIKPRHEFSEQVLKQMGKRGPTFWEMQHLDEVTELIVG